MAEFKWREAPPWRPERLPIEIWNEGMGKFSIVLRKGKMFHVLVDNIDASMAYDWYDINLAWEKQREIVKKLERPWWKIW